jgi:hypothetical protein
MFSWRLPNRITQMLACGLALPETHADASIG